MTPQTVPSRPEKRRTTNGRGKQDHLRLETQRGFADRSFHGRGHDSHLGRGDPLSNFQTRPKCVINLGRTEQMKCQLFASGSINGIERRTRQSAPWTRRFSMAADLTETDEGTDRSAPLPIVRP